MQTWRLKQRLLEELAAELVKMACRQCVFILLLTSVTHIGASCDNTELGKFWVMLTCDCRPAKYFWWHELNVWRTLFSRVWRHRCVSISVLLLFLCRWCCTRIWRCLLYIYRISAEIWPHANELYHRNGRNWMQHDMWSRYYVSLRYFEETWLWLQRLIIFSYCLWAWIKLHDQRRNDTSFE